jgi:probable F420-dependent oxidoreductase
MKIGIQGAGMGRSSRPGTLRLLAENCERLNFGTLWAPEHVVLFDQHDSKYPYSEDGRFALPSTSEWTEPFVALAYVAARTSRIRLATGICLVPEHNPLELAKSVASVDRLSGGRFALGVGVGWSAEEFQALGIPFERRAQRTREYIEVMRKLWSEEKSSHSGEFVSFKDVRSFPKPAQGGKVPIFFGGESVPALRRVAEYGNGWFGFNLDPAATAAKLERLDALLRENGRSRKEVEIVIAPFRNKVTPADLPKYHQLGVSEIVQSIQLADDETKIPAQLEQLAREWVEPAARLG